MSNMDHLHVLPPPKQTAELLLLLLHSFVSMEHPFKSRFLPRLLPSALGRFSSPPSLSAGSQGSGELNIIQNLNLSLNHPGLSVETRLSSVDSAGTQIYVQFIITHNTRNREVVKHFHTFLDKHWDCLWDTNINECLGRYD